MRLANDLSNIFGKFKFYSYRDYYYRRLTTKKCKASNSIKFFNILCYTC